MAYEIDLSAYVLMLEPVKTFKTACIFYHISSTNPFAEFGFDSGPNHPNLQPSTKAVQINTPFYVARNLKMP